jgi:hypothetical protein
MLCPSLLPLSPESLDCERHIPNSKGHDVKYREGAFDDARALLGKDVTVSLDDQEIVSGRLMTVSDSGEVVVVDNMGFLCHCWPLLDIHPKDSDASGRAGRTTT